MLVLELIAGVLPIAQGGTGATSAASARTNLGATGIGSTVFTAATTAAARTAIAAATGLAPEACDPQVRPRTNPQFGDFQANFAMALAKQLGCDMAIIDKRRSGHNVAESLTVIGDVAGKTAILIDDMIDTGGTICAGARLLRENGATRVLACATHPVFSGPAIERLSAPGLFEEVIVTNSIPLSDDRRFPQLQVLSVANMLGEAIWRIHDESSVSSMFR